MARYLDHIEGRAEADPRNNRPVTADDNNEQQIPEKPGSSQQAKNNTSFNLGNKLDGVEEIKEGMDRESEKLNESHLSK